MAVQNLPDLLKIFASVYKLANVFLATPHHGPAVIRRKYTKHFLGRGYVNCWNLLVHRGLKERLIRS